MQASGSTNSIFRLPKQYWPEVKWSENPSVVSDSLRPHGLYTVHGILQARILEWVAFLFSRGFFLIQGSTLQAGSLPAEPLGKPKNTGVGSLSLLQRIFPTQESNRGLLHCRQILYQLSYEGSPQLTRNKSEWLHSFNKCLLNTNLYSQSTVIVDEWRDAEHQSYESKQEDVSVVLVETLEGLSGH